MKRVLVTGGTGFIGRNALLPLRARGFEVHATYVGRPLEIDGIVWHDCDLLDSAAVQRLTESTRASHLLHFAWNVEHGKYWTSPLNLEWLEASLRLIRFFAESGGTRVVGAGTCAEYEWGTPRCIEGETPLRPASLYGAAKNALREVAESFARGNDISFAWGRIFLVYGPREDRRRLVPSVITSLLDARAAECSAGENVRDFLYVDDVADAFAALTDSEAEGAFNIGSGEANSIKDVARRMASMTDHPELLRLGALPERAGDPPFLLPDIARLNEEVGWRPKWSLEQGLAETVSWWRSQKAAEQHASV